MEQYWWLIVVLLIFILLELVAWLCFALFECRICVTKSDGDDDNTVEDPSLPSVSGVDVNGLTSVSTSHRPSSSSLTKGVVPTSGNSASLLDRRGIITLGQTKVKRTTTTDCLPCQRRVITSSRRPPSSSSPSSLPMPSSTTIHRSSTRDPVPPRNVVPAFSELLPSCESPLEHYCGTESGCVDFETDSRHCGSCENACARGERCSDGQCVTSNE